MTDIVEKRRSKRIPVKLELEISKLFRQCEIDEKEIGVPITVTDVSRHGVGFASKGNLPTDYYFNARLELGSPENRLFCVVRIVRKSEPEDGVYKYGSEFVGLAPILNYIFDDFERIANDNGTI